MIGKHSQVQKGVVDLSFFVFRVKRVNYTKAGGRVSRYQVTVGVGNYKDTFGWAKATADTVIDAKQKAVKLASKRTFKIGFDRFPYDVRYRSGRVSYILNKTRPGSGITASPTISLIMNLIGVKDCNVKVKNQRDLLITLVDISNILRNVRSLGKIRQDNHLRDLNLWPKVL